ncbi:T-cell surface glycoprotein CD8 beta chain [Acomys russatus]|uniref:T-cell surface glycoprotein CD8 beta chain n=1 Tax=Acomys russatus TaxID=60746 RepID=UPI0021E1CFB1|nr:T-cell surface glycoprotein CD8 beta chain [Acomys russatus]
MQPRLWLVFSVNLAALCSSSALLQTPPSVTVLTNGTAKVTCEARTSSKTTIYWLRQYENAAKAKSYEFLASCNPGNIPGKKMKKNIIVFSDSTRYFLNLTNVKPEDSGFYFCMMVGSPQLIFGTATELQVVDVLPTPAPTSKKTIVKKKQCPLPSPKTQKGPRCGLITLSLLVAGILVLLVSLSVAIHFHCLRRKARIRFMKQ